MSDPFKVVRDFESALCDYTGARFAVTTTSCTFALLLAVAWHIKEARRTGKWTPPMPPDIEIPKHTYIGVPMAIVHAGGRPIFRDEMWAPHGYYQLKPLPVWDSARWLSSGMCGEADRFGRGAMVCLSFHWQKTLGIQQGGCILHDDEEADRWLRKARFDGRTEGVAPVNDVFDTLGWHAYLSPEVAAAGLVRLAHLPRHNHPIPADDYADLSKLELFK
jgi:dTDP-4-amino-4,6-dideoxygalactose transaminase